MMTDAASPSLAMPLLHSAGSGDLARFGEELAAVKVGRLSHLAKETEFHRALLALAQIAASDPDPLRRLTALSLVGKADTATQSREAETGAACRAALRVEPPRLRIGDDQPLDADGRIYIAEALRHSDEPWLTRWAALALLDETNSDNARTPLAALVLDRSPSLAEAFDLLASLVPGSLFERPATKEPELTRTRRLARLCDVLEGAIRNTNVESGPDLPAALNRLLQSLAFRYSRPTAGRESQEVTEAAAAAIMTFVSTLIRIRFSISADPESYSAIRRLKSWFGQGSWPAALKIARAKLSQSVREAIALRARMQLPSRDLFAVLTQLTGDRRTAERQILPIADLPGIAPNIQDWLRSGGKRTGSREAGKNLEEAGLRDADDLIALASVRAGRLKAIAEGEAKAALAAIRQHPQLADAARALTQLVALGRAIPQDLELLLQRRSLSVFWNAGEIVENDPVRQEPAEGGLIDTQMVEVITPGVQRKLPNGTMIVVRKAAVRAK